MSVKSNRKLLVLSFGGGQDSWALLVLWIYCAAFRARYADYDIVAVMSDTGNEHPLTYHFVNVAIALCKKHDIPFYFITNDQGYHSDSWPDLISWMRRTGNIVMRSVKSCTDKLKIGPIYKFLDHYIGEQYGYQSGRKRALYSYFKEYGEVVVMIGIAKGEERRVLTEKAREAQVKANPWQQTIRVIYPLIDLGLDRKGCQETISKYGHEVPPPSNCMLCPYMSAQELLWLSRNYPEMLEIWIELEATKVAKFKPEIDAENDLRKSALGEAIKKIYLGYHSDLIDEKEFREQRKALRKKFAPKRNVGVFGTEKLLPEHLEDAVAKYGDWTDEQLNDYKFNHGCVNSKY